MPIPSEIEITLTRDELVTLAKAMARDPSTDDAKSRFPIVSYRKWTKEGYLHLLSILPLPLLREARQRAFFTFPAGVTSGAIFHSNYFTICGSTISCADINWNPRFCLRVLKITWGVRNCEMVTSEEEWHKGEESRYFRGTDGSPRALVYGKWFEVSPAKSVPTTGVLTYIQRPISLDTNYDILLEVEAAKLVAKYAACRKFEVDGELPAYQSLYSEYQQELKNLIAVHSQVKEQK